jgi:G:T-mismatch repair DNA endonuclease (very short patch repair protein)
LVGQGWRVVVIWECALRSHEPDLSWLPEHIRAGFASYAEWPITAA